MSSHLVDSNSPIRHGNLQLCQCNPAQQTSPFEKVGLTICPPPWDNFSMVLASHRLTATAKVEHV